MAKQGWIKLHKKLLENPFAMKDAEHLALWTYFLLEAAWEPTEAWFDGKKITLQPGQLVTGTRKLAKKFRVTQVKCHRIITCYRHESQIESVIGRDSQLITVKNWHTYQKTESPTESQVNQKVNDSESQVNTYKRNKEIKNKEDKNTLTLAPSGADHTDIVSIFDIFRAITDQEYWNKTQRKAASDLIASLGLEKVLVAAQYAVSVQHEQYAPVITNPLQLKKKMGELRTFRARSANSQKNLVAEI